MELYSLRFPGDSSALRNRPLFSIQLYSMGMGFKPCKSQMEDGDGYPEPSPGPENPAVQAC